MSLLEKLLILRRYFKMHIEHQIVYKPKRHFQQGSKIIATKKCVNGHNYDSTIYGDNCPFCDPYYRLNYSDETEKTAFPSNPEISEKIEKIKLLYSDKRMQYLAFHGKEALAEIMFKVKIYCVYTNEHFTITVKGLSTDDDVISYLYSSRFGWDSRIDLPYFSNWPNVKDVISKKVFRQYSRLVCELDDIEYVLRSERKDYQGNGFLYGCPRVSLLDRVSLLKTTEIIDYEEL